MSEDSKTSRPDVLEQWTHEHVIEWLKGLGPAFQKFAPTFEDFRLSGADLNSMESDEFEEMGIKGIALKKIQREIASLKKSVITSQALPTGAVLSPRSAPSALMAGMFQAIDIKEIEFKKKLGGGNFGAAFLANWRGVQVVVKRLHKVTPESRQEFIREAETLAQVAVHPAIVSMIGFSNDGDNFSLVSEFVTEGSVEDFLLKEKRKLDLAQKMQIASDSAAGFMFLHSKDIIHRDIAARNILLTSNHRAKITDFGLARAVTDRVDESAVYISTSGIGPVKWMAPESIKERKYNKKTDVYMFGIWLWELFAESEPYPHEKDLQKVAYHVCHENLRPPLLGSDLCPGVVNSIMASCWKADADLRPDMSRVHNQLEEVRQKMEKDPEAFKNDATSDGSDNYSGYLDLGPVEEKKVESSTSFKHTFQVTNYQQKKREHAKMKYYNTDTYTAPNGTKWHFRVYPNSGNTGYPNDVAIYLEREDDEHAGKTFKVGYTMRLLSPVKKEFQEVREFGPGNMAWGRHAFFKQSDIRSTDDTIELQVELEFVEEDKTELRDRDMSKMSSTNRIYVRNWSKVKRLNAFGRYHKTAEWESADGTHWHLRIYPNGGVSDHSDKVAVYVERAGDMPSGIIVKYTMRLIKPMFQPMPTFTETRTFSAENTAWGRHAFFAQEFPNPDDDTLVFEVEQIIGGEDIGSASRIKWDADSCTSTHRITISNYHEHRIKYGFKSYYETAVFHTTTGRKSHPGSDKYDAPAPFHFRVYPTGANDSHVDGVGVYLERHEYKDEVDQPLKIEYTMKLVDPPKSFTETRNFSKKNMAWGRHGLFKQISVRNKSSVELEVTMRVIGRGSESEA